MKDQYLAYMLRLWKLGDGENAVWHASLEDPHTGERLAFANVETLIAFLQGQTECRPRSEASASDKAAAFDPKSTSDCV